MDKRLKLNSKQKELVKQLGKLIKQMHKAHIGIVADIDNMWLEGLLFYNSTEVLDVNTYDVNSTCRKEYEETIEDSVFGDEDDDDEIWYTPNPLDIETLKINIDAQSSDDYWFSVLLERNEFVDDYLKQQEMAIRLKPLLDEKGKLKSKLQQLNDAILEIEDNIKKLEEKGVPQEIINEERTNADSNITQIQELKKEIRKLNNEIKTIKDNN
jgi:vacuolar-type H+-ATPase subunit I/STV1